MSVLRMQDEGRQRMTLCNREITKEIYDAAGGDGKPLKDRKEVFSDSEMMGYGIYHPTVYEEDGKYYCRFYMGDSCD